MKPIDLEIDAKIDSGFKIPDNYFENFYDNLILKNNITEIKTISIFEKRKKWFYSVAAVLILAISTPFLIKLMNQSTIIDDEALENYLVNNDKIYDNDIAELLTENDLENLNLNQKLEDKLIENELIQNENLEEYLIN